VLAPAALVVPAALAPVPEVGVPFPAVAVAPPVPGVAVGDELPEVEAVPAVAAVPEVVGVPAPATAVSDVEAPVATGSAVGAPAPVVDVPLVALEVAPSVDTDSATGPVNSGAGCRPTTPCMINATTSSGTRPIAGTSHHHRHSGAAGPRRVRTA
jgi:hypothetical protein